LSDIAVGATKHINRKGTSAGMVFVQKYANRHCIEQEKSALLKNDIISRALQEDA